MATYFHCFFWGLSLSFAHSIASTSHVYIVYLGLNPFHDPILTSNSHLQLLSNVFTSEGEAKQSLLYSYKHSFSGFSAMLNSTQAANIANMKGVISVFRSKTVKLHTTRSWDFLGIPLYNNEAKIPYPLTYGDNVIVGVFDSDSKSFKEEECLGPIPPSWKGKCVKGEEFEPRQACNRKLIGARYYITGIEHDYGVLNKSGGNAEFRSPRDFLGHGTHTASTAVGSIVKNVSFLGYAQGTARGGAPRARLAVYKVCWGKDGACTEADILAAYDDALKDGVNVISVSIGSRPPLAQFFYSSNAIGSFHAMQLGITVVFSAGNSGPDPASVENVSPWSISVAASTIDRSFPAEIVLNSNLSVMGQSFLTKEITGILANADMYFDGGLCYPDLWNNISAAGKIVICRGPTSFSDIAQSAVRTAKGTALIFVDTPTNQFADVDIIPTVRVDFTKGTTILNYINQFQLLQVVKILPSRTVIGQSPAPVVAPFSSRGPSSISPDFLKPDLTAPGINILAAWPSKTPPTFLPGDKRSVKWNFQSGTSMSCPHVSGVVALIKSAHPHWSPAAIRSALITTASTKDTALDSILAGESMKGSDPFDIGAGQISPLKAMDPGLIYDMKASDYIIYLCNIGYTQKQIKTLVLPAPGIDTSCSRSPKISNTNINYPSITVPDLRCSTTIKRTVRNVGRNKNAIYFASIVKPNGVEVVIWPRLLVFSFFKEELSYYVTLNPMKKSQGRYDFGEIVWSDGLGHCVRSPLVVMVNTAAHDDSTGLASSI
ncbi:subtilisin-like protease SBT3.18 isoform X2 [Ricinus communis]|uniref:subtilisin-like protease SBT3.18 isoform X2 n=1 Tax=Ricinus communis TaxID=3988 RepID=UPI00201A36EF|nr:subtilisin-like protease SBT3.18 isoform X2 [Ricinus communis]